VDAVKNNNAAKQTELEGKIWRLEGEMAEMEYHHRDELRRSKSLVQTLLKYGIIHMERLREDIANITDCEHAEEILELIEAWNNNVKEQLNEIALDDEY